MRVEVFIMARENSTNTSRKNLRSHSTPRSAVDIVAPEQSDVVKVSDSKC